jgi:hypothetical protein
MTKTNFTDEQLMAFADGEADAQTALAIQTALQSDGSLAQRVAMFTSSRNIARQAMPLLPVPSELEARIRALAAKSAPVEENAAKPAPVAPNRMVAANSNSRFWQVPLAASIALAIGLSSSYFMSGNQPSGTADLNIANLVDDGLKNALTTLPSGQERAVGDNNFKAIASFKDSSGNLCREFEKDFKTGASVVGIACHKDARWNMVTVVAANKAEDGYAPASSLDAIEAIVQSTGAGPTLSAEEELAALKALQ